MQIYSYTLFADYHQFYLQDEGAEMPPHHIWNEQTAKDMIAVAPGYVAVGAARNMNVPVEVEVRDTEPADELGEWDHVTECGIEIPSGKLVIAGCIDPFTDAARIPVRPGSYRMRVYYGDLEALSWDGLEGDDHYKVVLWPSDDMSMRVIKRGAGK
jgi:hypothetical protein